MVPTIVTLSVLAGCRHAVTTPNPAPPAPVAKRSKSGYRVTPMTEKFRDRGLDSIPDNRLVFVSRAQIVNLISNHAPMASIKVNSTGDAYGKLGTRQWMIYKHNGELVVLGFRSCGTTSNLSHYLLSTRLSQGCFSDVIPAATFVKSKPEISPQLRNGRCECIDYVHDKFRCP
jgi:hypothetical protein